MDKINCECEKGINEANENLVKIGLLVKNTEIYIYEYFEEYSDEIIKSVEANQQNLIKLSKNINQMTTDIEKSKNELAKLTTQFDTLDNNDKKFEDHKAYVVNQELHKILAEYQDSQIGNKFTFEFKELPIELYKNINFN